MWGRWPRPSKVAYGTRPCHAPSLAWLFRMIRRSRGPRRNRYGTVDRDRVAAFTMAQASQAEPGHGDGVLGHDHAAVHAQLARLLESPHFRNSKRSQALLRFVVQAALAGDQNSLKERRIGAAVFGREPAYDTAQDPIVRNAAIEVRKRLAQHYLEPEHAAELRIELPSGSYIPAFPAESAATAATAATEPAVPSPKAHGSPLAWIAAAALTVIA